MKRINQIIKIRKEDNILSLILFLFFSLLPVFSFSQKTNIAEQSFMIVKTAEKYHFQPRALDDEFSEIVFSGFLSLLDPYGLYFTKADIEKLEKSKYNIDSEIIEKKLDFLNMASEIYKQNLLFTDSILNSFKKSDFDFEENDSILISRKTIYFNQNQIVNRWREIIKYRVLYSYFVNIDSINLNKLPTEAELSQLKLNAIDRELCRLKSKLNYSSGLKEYVGVKYLKSIASAYDSYTSYFTKSDEEEFIQLLSKETTSFGFEISKNEYGEIVISQIIPGSSAWNSNLLNEGDVILTVSSNGIARDFNCIDLKEAVSFLSSADLQNADFLIKKKSKKEIELSLTKAEIDVQENIIKSFLLDGEKDIGYIYLPSFYSKKDDYSLSNGCANDIAKELIKLKNEGIEGLIIDLRFNGGGSMLEAVLMSGIFVDFGAVSIMQARDEDPITLKDMNRGTIYNSPIVILINEYSASASELFAASMQDLNRAVLVGSNSYGKSTMQEVLPIDAYKYDDLNNYKDNPQAFLKLSRGAFFRVNGESHHLKGVKPDVILPSKYDQISLAKNSEMSLDPVKKKTYYYPLPKLPIKKLIDSSRVRIDNDSSFIIINQIAKDISEGRKDYSIPLKIDLFSSLLDVQNQNYFPENNAPYIVKKPSYLNVFSSDLNSSNEIIENSIYEIEQDIYISEAFYIISDLINLQTK